MTYIQPVLPFVIVLLALSIVFFNRKPRIARIVVATTTLLLFLWAWPPTTWYTTLILERSFRHAQLAKSDAGAIVVLSAGLRVPNGTRQEALLDFTCYERTKHAAWLYRNGFEMPVLASGGGLGPPSRRVVVSYIMRDLLLANGVPPEMVWVETESLSTYLNAVHSARILKRKGVHKVILVTDGIHLPRAVRCFQKQGLEVVPAPSSLRSLPRPRRWSDYVPSFQAIQVNEDVLHEIIGLIWYRVSGKI
jgi:uncharacterized SAM-binding protein YcdF (DUF218 family)